MHGDSAEGLEILLRQVAQLLRGIAGPQFAAPHDLVRRGDDLADVFLRLTEMIVELGRALGAFFEKYDVLLSTTLARTSLPLGTVRMGGTLEQFDEAVAPMTPFTAVCNATGVPAMSVPLEWTDDNLPIGMHFVARYGDEETLYSLAAQLEQAKPWRKRRP